MTAPIHLALGSILTAQKTEVAASEIKSPAAGFLSQRLVLKRSELLSSGHGAPDRMEPISACSQLSTDEPTALTGQALTLLN